MKFQNLYRKVIVWLLCIIFTVVLGDDASEGSKDWELRKVAIEKIEDQEVLAKVALEDEDRDVCTAAVEKLTDQVLLAKIATDSRKWPVRMAAVKKLTDQELLAKVAIRASIWGVREVAVAKLTDQKSLAKIAIEDSQRQICIAAAKKLTDQEALAKVTIECKDWGVRDIAAEKLIDQEALAKVAIECKYWKICTAAVEKLTNQALLAKVVIKGENWDDRKVAFMKLTKVELTKLFKNANDPAIRIAAEVKLKNKSWDAVFDNNSFGIALGAIALFDKQYAAAPLVVQACHKYIRQSDASRIPELKELLRLYGNMELAEAYINSGQSSLVNAGRYWSELQKSMSDVLSKSHLATDINKLRELINRGADVNTTDNDGNTLLYIAANNGYTEIVKSLLTAKANPTSKILKNNLTPLFVATKYGYNEIVILLLEAGANVNTIAREIQLDIPTKETFVSEKIDDNTRIISGEFNLRNGVLLREPPKKITGDFTSLDVAAIMGREKIYSLLRKHGAKSTKELTQDEK